MHRDTLYTMEKPAHEWRGIVARCAATGQHGLRDLIRPHLVGRGDDEAVVIRAPLPVVGLVATLVDELAPGERPDAPPAPPAAPAPIVVAAGGERGAVALAVTAAGGGRPTRVGLTREQARTLARAILAITDPGR